MGLKKPKTGGARDLVCEYGKRVFRQDFFPDGKKHTFLLIEGTTRPVIIFPLTRDREVIAIRQFRYGADDFVLELPGGVPEAGEDLEDTVRRELRGETGYVCDTPVCLEPMWFEPAMNRTRFIPVIATRCEKNGAPHPDASEVLEVKKFTVERWLSMIRGREIRDSKTIAVTFLALLRLGLVA